MKSYNIIVLSENDSVALINTDSKSFQISNNGDKEIYTAEDVKAVIIKTMDTGPNVEDMYAEIHINDAIYIIPSEFPQYNNALMHVLDPVVPLNLALSIAASMCQYNETFVLYQKSDAVVEIEDDDEKRIAIVEASLKSFHEAGQSAGLLGFIFAMMSFCPMYLLLGKGEHEDQIVNLAAINENMVPIFTSLDRCPNGNQFKKRQVPADMYIKILALGNNDAMINFGTNYQLEISSQQIKVILLPLITFREDFEFQKLASKNKKKKHGFFRKLFKK